MNQTYCCIGVTTLSLAEPIERFGFGTNRASEFLVLSLGALSALDCTVGEIIAQLKMMLQVGELLVGI